MPSPQSRAMSDIAIQPDLVIHAPFEPWMDVISGKVGGMQTFVEGKCRAQGDFSLLRELNKWFGR